ncbi:uncharacterized protein N7459_009524 [Penicillium hispanicum]|uniref:uncharacterized protein n=1 Tax=Penicillium hispanicum TaxID=1080232 RepID=UPI0025426367|nr:uncharacterized protein N7459_009524 [Penicillium hispanicum]KAJ5570094.1 hypothetical protein N7459_009524 [Penicillium hispanicum]
MSYYDIDSILTDAQKLPCTFELEVPGLGILEGNPGEDIKAGTRIDLPLWLGEMLSIGARLGTSRLVQLDMPDALSERVMNALKADPRTVDLRALAPHFYSLSERVLELFEEEDMVDVLSDTFKTRAAEIADHAHNPRGAVGEGVDFLRGLDETERQCTGPAHTWLILVASSLDMEAAVMDRKSHRRSSAVHPVCGQTGGPVYQSETAPSARCVSSTSNKRHQHDRPKHPSLTRVKGRSNMNTPPRVNSDRSWLNDQSPGKVGTRTPPRQCKTPESGTPTLVNPASTLLQDLLKEQRAHRSSRGAAPDDREDNGSRTPEGGPRVQEETASEKTRKVSDMFTTGVRQPKEMGMREMDQYVSKMNKLNFDLKLEIFHRTQQMGVLEKKLERMHEMEEQLRQMQQLEEEVEELRASEKRNLNLRELNDQLRQELVTKDKAVAEAVEWICKLEAENEELKLSGTGGRTSQMSMGRLVLDGPNATTPKSPAVIEIPERTSSRRGQTVNTAKSSDWRLLGKAPSFLRVDNKSTATLRSLYAPENNKSRSGLSELTKSESFNTMTDLMEPESPRLSVLSECSELNPYETQFDKLHIPVHKASSTAGSLDSYVPPSERDESKEDQIDRWMGPRPDMSQTIIRRRQNRALSDASKTGAPSFGGQSFGATSFGPLFTKNPGRPRLDASLFGGARLPPTPDTMSTAYAAANNGSDGSIAGRKSPRAGPDLWFAGRPLDRHRSAGELTTRRSFNGSDITDSMQTNCSDTPRLGTTKESPTFFPFNTVASKASELLGPGSPSNPAVNPLNDILPQHNKENVAPATITPGQSPTKTVRSISRSLPEDSSPSLTPQDWIAAAKQGPRSRKERSQGLRIEPQVTESHHNVVSQTALPDNNSVDSFPAEPEVPGIPTLDLDTLEILEQPAEVPVIPESQPEPEPEPRRRISFRPPFFSRSNGPRRLQSSSVAPELMDDEDDGAPSPVIPKTRTMGGAARRPLSQIITHSADMYSSSLPPAENSFGGINDRPRALHQSLMEARESSLSDQPGPATLSARPTTSHSVDHKRRSSLGIFGWMKGVSGKRPEPATPAATDKFPESAVKEELSSGGAYEAGGLAMPRAATPDSMNAPVVRPRSEMTIHSDDTTRRPRYMGRRSRRG